MIKHKKKIIENLVIFFGIISMAIGFYFFFLPQGLVTGGVSGLAVLLEKNGKFSINSSYTIFILNMVFMTIGFFVMGKSYAIKTIFGSLFLPAILFIFEMAKIPQDLIIKQLTEVPIFLSAIIGTLFVSFGLGLVFRNGGSTGGIDIAQNIMRKKLHLNYPLIFAITDGIVVILGLIIFKDVQRFIYAAGSIVLMSFIVDNLSIAGRAGQTLFIITEKADKVKEEIFKRIDRGVTTIDAKGGYSNKDKKLIICVIHTRELNLTREVVEQTDPEAFTFIAQTKEAVGHGFTH